MKKVCVALSCYNQELYIKECIEHLLAQKCKAKVEILICDDASDDGTIKIIKSIIDRRGLPNGWSIKDYSNKDNQGMPENTKRILRLLMNSEGDDYWASPFWIQKHIEPMEVDEAISLTNNYLLMYNQEDNFFIVRQYPEKIHCSPYITSEMQAEDNYTGNFSSNMYRIVSLKQIPIDFLDQPYVDDWFVNLLISQQGNIYSLKEPISVYRVHNQSVWNGNRERRIEKGKESTITQRIRYMHKHYPNKYLYELSKFSEKWVRIPMMGKIYYDTGRGFNEEQSQIVYTMFEDKTSFWVEVELNTLPKENIKALRYDPEEGYTCSFKYCVCFADEIEIPIIAENGKKMQGKIRFDTKDPIFLLSISPQQIKNIQTIRIEGNIEFDEILN